ncbi:DEKNAAC100273 [Brettanomyces naardenensis]|uniref:nicotinamidase n=1 Tax=Brettanomyces naardenensis TaxID=13370 RepID=A0A448YFG8_BRENA|nr:DEKNAAC100273 [Brettanomyces naardenensis]
MPEKFNPALMIIDLQEDFLPPSGSLAVDNGRDIIPSVMKLLDLTKYGWKAIVGTKDWHPEGHISFASANGQQPYTTKEFNNPVKGPVEKRLETLWPDHCVQGTFGSAFPEEFAIVFNKMVEEQPVPAALIKKGYLKDREYYSCFSDVWKMHHTECEKFLKDNDITDVYVVGLAYDYCVLNSSIDAADLGFNTYVIKDVSKAVAPESNTETEKTYKEHNIQLITMNSKELAKVENNF